MALARNDGGEGRSATDSVVTSSEREITVKWYRLRRKDNFVCIGTVLFV
jgi:hypothetical protein